MLFFSYVFTLVLLLILLILVMGLSMKPLKDFMKISPFECGFVPKFNSRVSFSLQFFLLTLIFLIFDVELVLLFPFLFMSLSGMNLSSNLVLFVFVLLLSWGLFWEWNQTMLEWSFFS